MEFRLELLFCHQKLQVCCERNGMKKKLKDMKLIVDEWKPNFTEKFNLNSAMKGKKIEIELNNIRIAREKKNVNKTKGYNEDIIKLLCVRLQWVKWSLKNVYPIESRNRRRIREKTSSRRSHLREKNVCVDDVTQLWPTEKRSDNDRRNGRKKIYAFRCERFIDLSLAMGKANKKSSFIKLSLEHSATDANEKAIDWILKFKVAKKKTLNAKLNLCIFSIEQRMINLNWNKNNCAKKYCDEKEKRIEFNLFGLDKLKCECVVDNEQQTTLSTFPTTIQSLVSNEVVDAIK